MMSSAHFRKHASRWIARGVGTPEPDRRTGGPNDRAHRAENTVGNLIIRDETARRATRRASCVWLSLSRRIVILLLIAEALLSARGAFEGVIMPAHYGCDRDAATAPQSVAEMTRRRDATGRT